MRTNTKHVKKPFAEKEFFYEDALNKSLGDERNTRVKPPSQSGAAPERNSLLGGN